MAVDRPSEATERSDDHRAASSAVASTAATSFDLFGTLVTVEPPAEPASAVATELEAVGIPVPDDWASAYAESHVDRSPGEAVSLPRHVERALTSRGVEPPAAAKGSSTVEQAVRSAFDVPVETRPGAESVVAAAADRGSVAVLSNCSVPGLVEQTIERSALDRTTFDAVVSSVDCGWRKPHERAFSTVEDGLDIAVETLLHVGDDPATDQPDAATIDEESETPAGPRSLVTDDVSLAALAKALEDACR